MPSEKYEAMRLQTQRKLDQLVMRLDAKEPCAIKESRAILAKIVIDGNPLLLADVLAGWSDDSMGCKTRSTFAVGA